jgi:hypothetical protein
MCIFPEGFRLFGEQITARIARYFSAFSGI